jgi:DNA-3-methyladenine glycosylase I
MIIQLPYQIRPVSEQDRNWVVGTITKYWIDEFVVVNEEIFYPAQLPGFIAQGSENESVGLLTYLIRGDVCQIITLNSWIENQGVGSKLLDAVLETAEKSGCIRLSVTTTNDNLRAIDFYQKRGFSLREIRKGAVDKARGLKPSMPKLSTTGVPVNDEWEFVLDLSGF